MINKIKDIINNYKIKKYNIINSKESNFLNDNIKKIYVINLKSNIIRRNYIYVIMKKLKINYTLIIVEKINNKIYNNLIPENNITKAEFGCWLSHMWCLNDIIKNNYNNSIVFEDDIIFHKNFIELFKNIFNSNKYINILLLGACDFSFTKLNYSNVNNNLYEINESSTKVYGAHANYYTLDAATKIWEIHTTYKTITFFDYHYSSIFNHFKGSSFICYPNLVVSDISTTNLDHKYPFFSVAETNYYNKCFNNFIFKDYHFIYLCFLEKNKILENETYDQFISRVLYKEFYNEEKIKTIKNRLDLIYFENKDINLIQFNI